NRAELWHAKLVQEPHVFHYFTFASQVLGEGAAEIIYAGVSVGVLVSGDCREGFRVVSHARSTELCHQAVHDNKTLLKSSREKDGESNKSYKSYSRPKPERGLSLRSNSQNPNRFVTSKRDWAPGLLQTETSRFRMGCRPYIQKKVFLL